MRKKPVLVGLAAVLVAALVAGTALAAAIDPDNRTVTTDALFLDWAAQNPEAITDVRWNGSGNLTNSAVVVGCSDPLEFFGNAWVTENEGTPSFVFTSLVGWGSTGHWGPTGKNNVDIRSISSGCTGSLNLPVDTRYHFWNHGPVQDRIQVRRVFHFGTTPFVHNFRPYIPRLYPLSAYTQVVHPNADGTALMTEDSTQCELGCQVNDWNGTWYAIHNPSTGQGLIVRRDPSGVPANLWVDQDQASSTNASSALLLQPAGGFTGDVTEVEFLCFYDSSSWTPSLALPAGC